MADSAEAPSLIDEAIKDIAGGNLPGALTAMEKRLVSSPDDPQAQELTGQVLDMLGRDSEALPHLREAVRIAPTEQAFWNNLAIVSLRASGIAEGEEALYKSLDLGQNPLAFRLLGMIRVHQYRTQEGLSYFQKSLALAPDDPQSWFYVGNAHHLLGQSEAALSDYNEVLKRAPHNFQTQLEMGRVLQEMGLHEEARAYLQSARDAQPQNAEVHWVLSKSFLGLGEPEPALESARRAVGLKPDDARFHFRLGIVLARIGRTEEAGNEFQLFRLLEEKERKRRPPGMIDHGSWSLGNSAGINLNQN